uniref:Uncharacterized protein n=1 Tax=Arundo donax TaxID=35708 RepID=A0A0A9FKV0_ARUDO
MLKRQDTLSLKSRKKITMPFNQTPKISKLKTIKNQKQMSYF